jgi:hypothetical protein
MVPRPSSDIEVKRLLSDTMPLLERGLYTDKGKLLQLGRLTFMCYGANVSGTSYSIITIIITTIIITIIIIITTYHDGFVSCFPSSLAFSSCHQDDKFTRFFAIRMGVSKQGTICLTLPSMQVLMVSVCVGGVQIGLEFHLSLSTPPV